MTQDLWQESTQGLMLLASVAELMSNESVDLSEYLEATELKSIRPKENMQPKDNGCPTIQPKENGCPTVQPNAMAEPQVTDTKETKEDETTETDEEEVPVKRGRGRPKGSKNKINTQESLLQKRLRSDSSTDITAPPIKRPRGRPPGKKSAIPPDIHRKRRLYPTSLLDLEEVPMLKSTDQTRIALAEKKLQNVMSGKQLFGHKLILGSFQSNMPSYELRATLCNLFFFNVLFSSNALDSTTGKVSIFPVTIYKDDDQKSSGFPCLLIHAAHMKTLMWSIFSGCRQIFKNQTFRDNLPNILCSYSKHDDNILHALTGIDPYAAPPGLIRDPAYIIIPAHWLDVMKIFFLDSVTCKPHDIGHVCRVVYQNDPDMADKFADEYRCIWLGEERISNVSYLISTPDSHNVFSMTRCRAVNKEISRAGQVWSLWEPKADIQIPNYNHLSFAYGVECWKEQLQLLNTAVVFFTGQSRPQACHQTGLFAYVDGIRVNSRQESISKGILDDSDSNILLTKTVRRKRGALRSQFGEDFVINYFGNVGVYLKSKVIDRV